MSKVREQQYVTMRCQRTSSPSKIRVPQIREDFARIEAGVVRDAQKLTRTKSSGLKRPQKTPDAFPVGRIDGRFALQLCATPKEEREQQQIRQRGQHRGPRDRNLLK